MNLIELEAIIKSLVLSYPHGITMVQLNRDFKSEIGYSIPFPDFGFYSLESFLSSLNNSITLIKRDGRIYITSKTSAKTMHIECMISEQKKTKRRVRFRGFSNRWITSPKMTGNANCNPSINFTSQSKPDPDLKLTSVNNEFIHWSKPEMHFVTKPEVKVDENLCNSLKKVIHKAEISCDDRICAEDTGQLSKDQSDCTEKLAKFKDNSGCYQEEDINSEIYSVSDMIKDFAIDRDFRDEKNSFPQSCSIKLPINLKRNGFPDFAALPEDTIFPAIHPMKFVIDAIFCLYISEVHNPYKFWFHMDQHSKILDELMYKLELFNKNLDDVKELNMQKSHIKPKQLCAALYDKYWHRAEILQVPVDDMVKVYFVDYGTVDYVSTSSIRFIHKGFIKVPSQVYRGCLSYLKPANIKWGSDCTYFLIQMICEKKLWAKIVDFDEMDNIYHIILLDTNGEVDVNINFLLIKEGYAKLMQNNADVGTHFQYVYPTFDMLETGEYASFKAIGEMLAWGYNYEFEEYRTLKSINPKKLYGYSILEFWKFIKEKNTKTMI